MIYEHLPDEPDEFDTTEQSEKIFANLFNCLLLDIPFDEISQVQWEEIKQIESNTILP